MCTKTCKMQITSKNVLISNKVKPSQAPKTVKKLTPLKRPREKQAFASMTYRQLQHK